MTHSPGRSRQIEELSPGKVISLEKVVFSREMIVGYAREFDPLPFHLDERAARRSLLGGLAASGWQTALMAQRLLVDGLLGELDARGLVSVSDLKWTRPVLVGDIISGTGTITEITPLDDRSAPATITLALDIRNQRDERVLSMICRYRVGSTPKTGEARR